VLFIASNPKINQSLLLILFVAIFFFTISTVLGNFKNGSFELKRFAFIYKYLFIFVVPWIFVSVVKTKEQIRKVNWILLINFILLSSWVYIYLVLSAKGKIVGAYRPSFPFSNDYRYSDAHLYSAYLGFFLVAYLFYLRTFFNHKLLVVLVITTNGIVGLLLTGSRTGVVLVSVSLFIYGLYYCVLMFIRRKKRIVIRKKNFLYFFLSIFFVFILALISIPYFAELLTGYERLFQRIINLDFANEQSIQGRIDKLIVSVKDAEDFGLLFGVGFYSSLVWYDGLFALLLAHGGIFFIASIFVFYYLIVKNAAVNSTNQKEFLLFFLLVFLYLIANLITEYIFVSRNAFPVLVMLSVLYVSIINKKNM
jgi:hypothetical protein